MLNNLEKTLYEALKLIPDPEDEGCCYCTPEHLDLIWKKVTYPNGTESLVCHYKHASHCWFTKVQEAIMEAQECLD